MAERRTPKWNEHYLGWKDATAVGRMRIEVPSGGRKGEGGAKATFLVFYFFLNLRRTEFLPQTLAEEKEKGEK